MKKVFTSKLIFFFNNLYNNYRNGKQISFKRLLCLHSLMMCYLLARILCVPIIFKREKQREKKNRCIYVLVSWCLDSNL